MPCVTPLSRMPTPSVAMKELIWNWMRRKPLSTPTNAPPSSIAGITTAAPNPRPPSSAPTIIRKPSE